MDCQAPPSSLHCGFKKMEMENDGVVARLN
jgi:hypothetical protein